MTKASKHSAFDRVIRENQSDLLRFLHSRAASGADAGDAFGEMLYTAWRLRRKMPEDALQARLWLFGVARNTLRNANRLFARRSAATQRLVDELRAHESQPVDDPASARVRSAIAELPEGDAELVRLIYWDGLKSHEAAAVLGLNPSTVRTRLSTARQRLREILATERLDERIATH